MGVFDDEMFNRLWWCIYLMDRRLSLDCSRPFLIQDCNIEIRMPLDVHDSWLEKYRQTSKTVSDLTGEIEAEKSQQTATVVPFLKAYISQSKIAADVWKVFYNTKQAGNPSGLMHEYLDAALDSWWDRLPRELKYQEAVAYQNQFFGVEWWQAKQNMLLYMVGKLS